MTPLQWKRLFFRIIIWVCLLALLALLYTVGSATWRVYTKGQDAKKAHENADQNLIELNQRKVSVEERLKKLETEEGFEAEVRNRYQLAKPGEEVIVIVPAQSAGRAASTTESKGIWESFLSWFSH
jgi:cell division protein FtsB